MRSPLRQSTIAQDLPTIVPDEVRKYAYPEDFMNDAARMETLCSNDDVTAFDRYSHYESLAEKRIFVLDTNVLVHDPHSIFKFGD
ncbi:MAG TPA: hypothetical protein VN260_10910, partial [Dissulfurispiraceae bacterium]|nr:hypothetical protein [Dissulfurispiraceae bacterium]